MIDCPRHGRLLYGTKCTDCDCRLARFHDGGVIPKGTVHMGFDLASGPDKSATIRMHRVSDRYEFRVEDIELMEVDDRAADLMAEQMRRHRERMEEALWGAFNVPPEHFNCRSAYAPPAVEIITDPADRRGLDAKPIGGARP